MGPRELFNRGELSACIRLTARSTSFPERLLHARALMRLSRHREALDALAQLRGVGAAETAQVRAYESSCHALAGSVGLARKALASVHADGFDTETRFEVAYARMLLGWVEGTPDTMEAALFDVDVSSVPHLYGQWLYSRSWVAALREDYLGQLKLLEQATAHIAEVPAAYDVALLASATRSLVHLVREISAQDTYQFAVRMAESIPWTADLESERFLTFRGLAWAHALRGSHEKALHYAYFARDIAPSVMWVAACYADQAYLARMASENRSADALLRHATACARETDWTSPGEERVALLNLVELLADCDTAAGRALLDIYDDIPVTVSPRLALAHDRRMQAMEEYARGTMLSVSGYESAGADLLESAYSTFRSLHYAWRAAAAALRLNAVTGQDAWLRCAREAVAEFPDSSVADQIRRKADGASDPRVAALTPAQRRVFGLMCEGLTDKQIAQALRISPETAKNHAARIRAAFGVHSRAALIASARHAG